MKGDVYTESVISFAGFGYWREEPSDQPKVARGWTNLLWVVYPPRAHTHAGTTPPYTCMLSVVDHVIKMILPACKAGKVLGGFHMQAEMGQRMQPQLPLFPSLPQTPPGGQPQG